MEDEIEDITGEAKYSESQKSVATSNVYSLDFTDSCSEKQASSGQETYVIACDSDDSDQSNFTPRSSLSVIHQNDNTSIPVTVHRNIVQCQKNTVDVSASTSQRYCTFFAQETYTQTSKTILDLNHTDINVKNVTGYSTLETQTSFMSLAENRTVKYKIQVSGTKTNISSSNASKIQASPSQDSCIVYCNDIFASSCDESSKMTLLDSKTETSLAEEAICITDTASYSKMFEESKNLQENNTSDRTESFNYESDVEPDSLMEDGNIEKQETASTASVPISVDNEVEELYNQLSNTIELPLYDRSEEKVCRRPVLTPLTEESANKKESLIDITPSVNMLSNNGRSEHEEYGDSLSSKAYKLQMLSYDEDEYDSEQLKLPPIKLNHSCPTVCPQLGFLFSGPPQCQSINRSGTLPSLIEVQNEKFQEKWEVEINDLGSGESPLVTERSDTSREFRHSVLLPPINPEAARTYHPQPLMTMCPYTAQSDNRSVSSGLQSSISIQQKIKELKVANKLRRAWTTTTSNRLADRTPESRSGSPGSMVSRDDRVFDIAEKSCDTLCVAILKKLKSSFWYEIVETLESIASQLEKFWRVINENRIADLIRQVCCHVESPRTQVARAACTTLSVILKNTNYTKKPDFYEAVTILLAKTGSYCRPVRKAANMALDDVASHVDVTHTVTALCLHGVEHKNPLVRCAAARVLVVCSALAGGGRGVMRARPLTAATARTYMLRALSLLLDDKNTDTRKYAERLYTILRPLPTFEAYYLNDVDVDTATRQMKKYDHLLMGQMNGNR